MRKEDPWQAFGGVRIVKHAPRGNHDNGPKKKSQQPEPGRSRAYGNLPERFHVRWEEIKGAGGGGACRQGDGGWGGVRSGQGHSA